MSIADRYLAYAEAFETTFADDDWSRLTQFFTPDATYEPGDGTTIEGRDAMMTYLQQSVNSLDRRFDSRELADFTPEVDGNQVSMSWTVTFNVSGAPDLVMTGKEIATFSGDVIERLEDIFDDDTATTMESWMEANGAALG